MTTQIPTPQFHPAGALFFLFKVVTNTDLTEGRGSLYTKFLCSKKTTAIRLASKAGVQGSNAEIVQVIGLSDSQGNVWVRLADVPVVKPTELDVAEDRKYEIAEELLKKIKSLNLTADELRMLPNLGDYSDPRIVKIIL